MGMRKFGAPKTSHVRFITAEDVEETTTNSKEENQDEQREDSSD